ncbi:hypothetical protein IAD21_01425 [Abditibacteriota bacterium]|nr:hypothetical protein IAD21_01425 [Abditibacteriota bacterium]
MKMQLVIMALILSAATPLVAVPRQMVDYDFGTQQVAWKPDGNQLALQDKHGVAIRDAHTLRLMCYFPLEQNSSGSPTLHSWCGDNLVLEKVVEANREGNVADSSALLLSAQTGKTRAIWSGVDFSYANQTLWFHQGQCFHVLATASQQWFDANLPLRTSNVPKSSWPSRITFSADGRFAAEQLGDGSTRLWNIATSKVTAILSDRVYSAEFTPVAVPVVWSPDGNRVATLGQDPMQVQDDFAFAGAPNDGPHWPVVKIWDACNGQLIRWFNTDSAPQMLAWCDNENLIVEKERGIDMHVVGSDNRVFITPHSSASLSPDRMRLFASSNLIQFGKNNQTRVIKSLFPAPPEIVTLAWGAYDGHSLIVYGSGREQIWNIASLSPNDAAHSQGFLTFGGRNYEWSSRRFAGEVSEWHGGRLLAFSIYAKELLRVRQNGVYVLDRKDNVLATLTHDIKDIRDAQFSPNGRCIALARTHSIEIYIAATGQLVATLYAWPQRNPTSEADWLVVRPDGTTTGTQAARNLVVSLPE